MKGNKFNNIKRMNNKGFWQERKSGLYLKFHFSKTNKY